jgi:exopolysaccharide biosynthesis polyprenyl glycosylphosphotransferase
MLPQPVSVDDSRHSIAQAALRNGPAGRPHDPEAQPPRLLGYVRVVDGGGADAAHYRWFSSSAELEHIVRKARVRKVYIADGDRDHPEAARSAVEVCQRYGIPCAPRPAHGPVASIDTALVARYREFVRKECPANEARLKRAVDVVLSLAALLALLPLMALLAAVIKLTDGGPILFGQQRVGLRGRMFTMLKFRSMIVEADELKPRLESENESDGPVFKMRRDPRITGIGTLLRKYSLDELPQLINVLRGEMSIVGPRPPLASEVEQYEPWHFGRLAVRPGLTCLWQVSPGRYRMAFDDWVRLDLQYVDQWSLRLDVRLILRTFWVVLAGTGE